MSTYLEHLDCLRENILPVFFLIRMIILSQMGLFCLSRYNSYSEVPPVHCSLSIRHFHIDHNALCLPPKTLHNHCFQFLLGITYGHPKRNRRQQLCKIWGSGVVVVGEGVKQGALWSMEKW